MTLLTNKAWKGALFVFLVCVTVSIILLLMTQLNTWWAIGFFAIVAFVAAVTLPDLLTLAVYQVDIDDTNLLFIKNGKVVKTLALSTIRRVKISRWRGFEYGTEDVVIEFSNNGAFSVPQCYYIEPRVLYTAIKQANPTVEMEEHISFEK